MTLSPTVFFVRPIRLHARDRRTNNRQRGTFMWSTWLSDIAFRAKISYLERKLRWWRKPSADGGRYHIPLDKHQINTSSKYEHILKKCRDFRAPNVSCTGSDRAADTLRIDAQNPAPQRDFETISWTNASRLSRILWCVDTMRVV